MMGDPVLKKPTVAFVACGGWLASNRKLYKVPQRIAFAFWFCAKVSELQVRELEVCVESRQCCYIPHFPQSHRWPTPVPERGHEIRYYSR